MMHKTYLILSLFICLSLSTYGQSSKHKDSILIHDVRSLELHLYDISEYLHKQKDGWNYHDTIHQSLNDIEAILDRINIQNGGHLLPAIIDDVEGFLHFFNFHNDERNSMKRIVEIRDWAPKLRKFESQLILTKTKFDRFFMFRNNEERKQVLETHLRNIDSLSNEISAISKGLDKEAKAHNKRFDKLDSSINITNHQLSKHIHFMELSVDSIHKENRIISNLQNAPYSQWGMMGLIGTHGIVGYGGSYSYIKRKLDPSNDRTYRLSNFGFRLDAAFLKGEKGVAPNVIIFPSFVLDKYDIQFYAGPGLNFSHQRKLSFGAGLSFKLSESIFADGKIIFQEGGQVILGGGVMLRFIQS